MSNTLKSLSAYRWEWDGVMSTRSYDFRITLYLVILHIINSVVAVETKAQLFQNTYEARTTGSCAAGDRFRPGDLRAVGVLWNWKWRNELICNYETELKSCRENYLCRTTACLLFVLNIMAVDNQATLGAKATTGRLLSHSKENDWKILFTHRCRITYL